MKNILTLIFCLLCSYIYKQIPIEYNVVDWRFVFAMSMGVILGYFRCLNED